MLTYLCTRDLIILAKYTDVKNVAKIALIALKYEMLASVWELPQFQ